MARRGDIRVRGRDIRRAYDEIMREAEQNHLVPSPREVEDSVYCVIAKRKGIPFIYLGGIASAPDPRDSRCDSVSGKIEAYFMHLH